MYLINSTVSGNYFSGGQANVNGGYNNVAGPTIGEIQAY
jgi:hypothetical protein